MAVEAREERVRVQWDQHRLRRYLGFLRPAMLVMIVLAADSAAAASSTVRSATLEANGTTTFFRLDMTVGVKADIFTLADPFRVVIELPAMAFALPPGTGIATGTAPLAGLVRNYRFGAFAADRSRIVLDTTGPVAVSSAEMTNIKGGVRLEVALLAVDEAAFGSGTGAARGGRADTEAGSPPAARLLPQAGAGKPAAPGERARPLVMIDPGHGGVDPGAVGSGKTTEKSVVLAVAWQLKQALDATGRYDTRLTRTSDVFIPLDKRVAMAEEARADLFLSLHADAIDDVSALTASGASIYTLSERASDEQARKMAEKENSADLVAGIGQRNLQAPDEVKGILSDLWARENSAFSHLFSRSLVSSLSKIKAAARQPERSAAFRVLKQSQAPAVLIELGFLSNPAEEQRLASAAWQRQIAGSIALAVNRYFEQRKNNAFVGPGVALPGGLPP